ncbi:hypothetical protein QBC34DRAFT_471611 [Podospora aff. communis PSN243]|uniref:DUF5648 domain-containing protein n=1 Tax=Podospora aff. communis PSN243 TaxID=3040156 RepID=A0AAV9GF42_9PEZI|nr:hypothetical protein QBC34DRAFT_471611 [Podospora aff. communis PSN243]
MPYHYTIKPNDPLEAEARRRYYKYDGIACYVDNKQLPFTTPVYRWCNYANYDYFYSTDPTGGFAAPAPKSKYVPPGIAFWIYKTQQEGTIPFYVLHHPLKGIHFYTVDQSEEVVKVSKGYTRKGVLGYVYARPVAEAVPLYRYCTAAEGELGEVVTQGEIRK